MSSEKLYQLLQEYFGNTISAKDCAELLAYLSEASEEEILPIIDDVLSQFKTGAIYSEAQSKDVYSRITQDNRFKTSLQPKKEKEQINFGWIRYAAVLLLVSTISIYFFVNKKSEQKISGQNTDLSVRLPILDAKRVVLSVGDGSSVVLDSTNGSGNTFINITGNSPINNSKEGVLAYTDKNNHQGMFIPVLHTLSVPRGTTYRIELPDGTKVWLNSATTLTYPSSFTHKTRNVILNGEAYFEVAKKTDQPFTVEANGNKIEVLGTHFNITAYKDDSSVKTTLLEGSVKVSNNSNTKTIMPGIQAVAQSDGAIVTEPANTEEVMAWKNGAFTFVDADIESIMKELVRWYDIEVEFKGRITEKRFGGTFSKKKTLDELLSYLEAIGNINFKIVQGDAFGKGRRVIVMP